MDINPDGPAVFDLNCFFTLKKAVQGSLLLFWFPVLRILKDLFLLRVLVWW